MAAPTTCYIPVIVMESKRKGATSNSVTALSYWPVRLALVAIGTPLS